MFSLKFLAVALVAATYTSILGLGDAADPLYFFNFTSESVDDWVEQSDTVRATGMSKGVIATVSNTTGQRAVFLSLLNPQEDGSGFAGVRKFVTFNASEYTNLEINCRGQGNTTGFKVVMRHKGLDSNLNYTYEQFFTGPSEFSTVSLPLSDFKPYFRGVEVTDGEEFDKSNITVFGFQYYAGVFETINQTGPASLEVDWVRVNN